MIELRSFDMLCMNKRLSLAAARASAELMQRFDLRFSLDCWDHRAIAAFAGGEVVGFVQFKKDEKRPTLELSLAWCSSDFPRAFVLLAGAVRSWARAENVGEITFTYHEGNEKMARLAQVIGAGIRSHYCTMELSNRSAVPAEPS